MDYGDKRTLPLAITAREIADDLCREINSDAGEHSFLGVFVCAGDAPSEEELRAAREKLDEFYRALVAAADREWERSHSFLFIHDLQRRAAANLGLRRNGITRTRRCRRVSRVRRAREARRGRVQIVRRDSRSGEGASLGLGRAAAGGLTGDARMERPQAGKRA